MICCFLIKPIHRLPFLAIILFMFFLLSGCRKTDIPEFRTVWSRNFNKLGSSSSIRCVDLNKDKILDIVIGAAENEFEPSDSAVVALDGKTGKVLWSVFAQDQIVGSAAFLDITHDAVPDIFIGGRSAELICINGATGQPIWRFQKSEANAVLACCLRFNFFNPQIIPDQDHDGLPDILVSNGGNVKAIPFSETERFPGVLAVFSSKNGQLIAAATMPDGKETYMSPVIYDFAGQGTTSIIFGTGGETIGGNLFITTLAAVLQGDISGATKLASGAGRGFIAPPTLADVTADGTKDIIVNWFGGKMIAINGKTHATIWERPVPGTEVYGTAVPGRFNADDIPDFFSIYNQGAWPNNKGSVQLLIDGKTGEVLNTDSLGCMGYASGVVLDINADNFDEIIFSVNDFVCNAPAYAGTSINNSQHSLQLLDYHHNTRQAILPALEAKNVSSTPWVGDLEQDGFLDIIYCMQRNNMKVDQYRGMRLERLRTNIKITQPPTCGAYMGNNGTNVFK